MLAYLSPNLTHSTIERDLALCQPMPPGFFPERLNNDFSQILQCGTAAQGGEQVYFMFAQ